MKRKRAGAAVLLCSGLLTGKDAFALIAFPGAEGFGANALGGRGGDVYHVTTLADDPNHLIPGSLFYGLYNAKNVSARTIVFDVGGTIKLGSSTLDIKNIDNVTIAGQTAPSPITIVGNSVQITSSSGDTTSNIILQHIAIRKGLANSGDALSIKGSGTGTSNIMVDHVSGSWSEDEVISVGGATNSATNVTVQYSTMSEALTSGHQYGSLIRSRANSSVSYMHNLYSNNASRNPRPGTYLGMQLDFEFQNNVVYNWNDRAGYTGGASETATENVNMNYAGNYLIAGPSTVGGPTTAGDTPIIGAKRNTAFTKDASDDPLNLNIYQSGNKIDWAAGATRDGQDIGWDAFANWNGTTSSAFPAADQEASRFLYPAATPDSADDAYGKVISSVGAFPYARTATDQRLVNEVLTYTGVALQSTPNSGEWTALDTAPTVTRAAGWDTDNDGMPNSWETARGLNPSVAGNNSTSLSGPGTYTNLEHYLQYLTYVANWNLNADGNWSDYLNWRGDRPTIMDATANFIAGTTAPRTVTVDIPATIGQLSFDGTNSYTLAGAGTITLNVISGKATIGVISGNHSISAPLVMSDSTDVTVPAGSTLTASNLQSSSVALTKAGAGTLAVNNVRAGSLAVTGGTVKILTNSGASGVSTVPALSIAAGAKLDLNDNKLITNNAVGTQSGGIYDGVQGLVQTANNPGGGGVFDGPSGITTTQTDATNGSNLTTIGVTTGAISLSLGPTDTAIWAGQTVSGDSTMVMYTYMGDADLSGFIDGTDYFYIDSNVNTSADGYGNGDFNYDGSIDGTDYFFIDSNIGSQGAPFFASGGAELLTGVVAVPEPASLSVIGIGASAMIKRRRRIKC